MTDSCLTRQKKSTKELYKKKRCRRFLVVTVKNSAICLLSKNYTKENKQEARLQNRKDRRKNKEREE